MTTVDETVPSRPAETVAGFLAALAIFIALIGLAWHPLRLIGPAIIVALVASAMAAGRHKTLAFAALLIVAACFFFGLLIAVVTSRALW